MYVPPRCEVKNELTRAQKTEQTTVMNAICNRYCVKFDSFPWASEYAV